MENGQQWKEASKPMYPNIRWEEVAKPGKEESTMYFGPVVQGIYVEKKTGVGGNDSTIYVLEVNTPIYKGKVGLWGSQVLDDRFSVIPLNHEVRITLLSVNKAKVAGRNDWKNFKVEFAAPVTQMTEVNTVAAPAGSMPTAAPAAGNQVY